MIGDAGDHGAEGSPIRDGSKAEIFSYRRNAYEESQYDLDFHCLDPSARGVETCVGRLVGLKTERRVGARIPERRANSAKVWPLGNAQELDGDVPTAARSERRDFGVEIGITADPH